MDLTNDQTSPRVSLSPDRNQVLAAAFIPGVLTVRNASGNPELDAPAVVVRDFLLPALVQPGRREHFLWQAGPDGWPQLWAAKPPAVAPGLGRLRRLGFCQAGVCADIYLVARTGQSLRYFVELYPFDPTDLPYYRD